MKFFKAKDKATGQPRLVSLVQDEYPDDPLLWADPIKDHRPLFVLTNHRRYVLGDKDAESIGWTMVQNEPKWDRGWEEKDFDILECWVNGAWETVPNDQWRQTPGIVDFGTDSLPRGGYVTEIQHLLEWRRIDPVQAGWNDGPGEGGPPKDDNLYRWNVADNPQYLGDELPDLAEAARRVGAYILLVYMYDHSDISLSTSNSGYPFNCPWDSGVLGFIMWTRKEVEAYYKKHSFAVEAAFTTETYSTKLPTDEELYDQMRSYLKTYNDYVSGEVYGITVHTVPEASVLEEITEWEPARLADEIVDSCWGFYGYADAVSCIAEQFGLEEVEAVG